MSAGTGDVEGRTCGNCGDGHCTHKRIESEKECTWWTPKPQSQLEPLCPNSDKLIERVCQLEGELATLRQAMKDVPVQLRMNVHGRQKILTRTWTR